MIYYEWKFSFIFVAILGYLGIIISGETLRSDNNNQNYINY